MPGRWEDVAQEVAVLPELLRHPESAALLASVFAGDEAARLVWADWLEGHGCVGRAALVRVQCDPASYPLSARDLETLEAAFSGELKRPVEWIRAQFDCGLPAYQVGDVPAVDFLMDVICTPGEMPRGWGDGPAWPASLEDWMDIDPLRAVQILGNLGTADAVGALTFLAFGTTSDIRSAAVTALGGTGNPDATKPLLATLTDLDDDIRRCGAAALGALGDRSAIDALSNVRWRDPEGDVRSEAARALERLGVGSRLAARGSRLAA